MSDTQDTRTRDDLRNAMVDALLDVDFPWGEMNGGTLVAAVDACLGAVKDAGGKIILPVKAQTLEDNAKHVLWEENPIRYEGTVHVGLRFKGVDGGESRWPQPGDLVYLDVLDES